ncbi:MAG: HAD-IA family hydrolase [Rhodospirillales bacterium]|nr:HAD-IA family hydrolase [Rhodospirillales bacterium]
MSRFKAVIFDLDGTLVDSAADLCAATNEVLKLNGRRTIEVSDVRQMVGDGAAVLIQRAFDLTGSPCPESDLPKLTEVFINFYDGKGAVKTIPYEGVMEVLEKLKADGLKLAVCTNKPQGPTDGILEELKMAPYFQSVIGGDTLPFRKPDGRHVEAVVRELGVTKEETLFVGDSPNDVQAAQNANLTVVAVSYGYTRVPPAEMGANLLIDLMSELPKAMEQLS